MAAIELRNVVKTYPNGTSALDDVSLDIADGEFMALVGPSGCGKSTLLRVVAGLEEITSGEVLIGGELANGLPPNERNVAMAFQTYALYPQLTVYENIAFPLRVAKSSSRREIDRLVRDASRTLGLDDVLQSKPAVLSGGQRQRVAMGRAMVRDPQALLLDEPLSNLDARLRSELRAEIAWLQRCLGTTTLYVTHDQSEAMALGDRVVVLERGRVQQIATPRDLYRHPANLFVADFVGSPPMEFLPSTVTGDVVEFSFAWVRISREKAARVHGREQLIAGLRPEHVRLEELAGTDHQYARIPLDVPPGVPDYLAEYERELASGPRLSLDPRGDYTRRFLERGRDDVYVNAKSLHLFDPATGQNLTRDLV
ncbi:MAG: ATP-binding cassette domain-containing protein [Nocardioidaceae bacterium]|nr:ATP-binding cassette domain-containing protein [Nocardioidaceae bacterium]